MPANWSGVEMKGSAPWLTSLSLMSGLARITAMSADIFSTMSLGVRAGARMPYQPDMS